MELMLLLQIQQLLEMQDRCQSQLSFKTRICTCSGLIVYSLEQTALFSRKGNPKYSLKGFKVNKYRSVLFLVIMEEEEDLLLVVLLETPHLIIHSMAFPLHRLMI